MVCQEAGSRHASCRPTVGHSAGTPSIGNGRTTMANRFRDRHHAGKLLAGQLVGYVGRSDVLILALPRGGVPVAFEVAQVLRARLDVFLVRKLGVPGQEELA